MRCESLVADDEDDDDLFISRIKDRVTKPSHLCVFFAFFVDAESQCTENLTVIQKKSH